MQVHRFYCQNITKGQIELTGNEARHLINVLRLNPGEQIELFDGKGALAKANIESIRSGAVVVDVIFLRMKNKLHSQRIVIASSIPKADRFEWLIEKCTELGADRIIPVIFQRTVKKPKNPKILDRWKNKAVSAAKQSKRVFLPKIDLPLYLIDVLENVNADYHDADILTGSIDTDAEPVAKYEFAKDIVVIVGPEGGITEQEEKLLHRFNAKPVKLTDTILRTETAAITFTSIFSSKRNS